MRFLVLCYCLLLTACATTSTASNPEQLERPILCQAGADCDTKWSRALFWVQKNSTYRIQIANDALITTFGPLQADPSSAFSISKLAHGNGQYSIHYSSSCANWLGCIPSPADLRASFDSFVQGASSHPQGTLPKDNTGKMRFGALFAKTNDKAAAILKMEKPRGLIVISIYNDSIAQRAGIKQGDVVLQWDNIVINDMADLASAIKNTPDGATVKLTIWRVSSSTTITAQF